MKFSFSNISRRSDKGRETEKDSDLDQTAGHEVATESAGEDTQTDENSTIDKTDGVEEADTAEIADTVELKESTPEFKKKAWKLKNPFRLYILDRYILKQFLATFGLTLLLMLAVIAMFDVTEKLDAFLTAPLSATIFDYFMSFLPFLALQLTPLFVFISVIFFTSKMAGNSEIIAILSSGVSLHNRKLRDCRIHYNDAFKQNSKNEDQREASSIFITEGDSASGTITKVRNAQTQAVFSLRGKPLNSFGMTQEVVYKNDEFNLLQAALNIEDGIDGLRYNKVIIATDADVDGMHIRLLVITFFLMFFPDLVKKGHVYILQTPLFRVRNKNSTRRSKGRKQRKAKTDENGEKDTYYCYSDEEREAAIAKFGSNAEITRFKGLGEINDVEFAEFIGPDMRLDPVTLKKDDTPDKLLEFYMGKNTMERQNFIIDNLVIEDDSEI